MPVSGITDCHWYACEWEEITDFNEKCPEIPALTLNLQWNFHSVASSVSWENKK